jgi:hypothetical protein
MNLATIHPVAVQPQQSKFMRHDQHSGKQVSDLGQKSLLERKGMP